MLFNSFSFVVLLLVTFTFYYIPHFKKQQVTILLISSTIFYAYHTPLLLTLFICSILINSIISFYLIFGNSDLRKICLVLAIITNLGILAFFKYTPWLISLLIREVSKDPINFLISLPLPIGISFYTFEGISLIIDTSKDNDIIKRSLIKNNFLHHLKNTALFISFFPHLISGPILKARDFIPQIKEKELLEIDWSYVMQKLVTGYFLKMVIADNLKYYTHLLEYPYFTSLDGISILILIFSYSFQIFSDFAGYSLIALGLAALFGYKLNENFDFPYISQSFTEFWKRWHISLSTWLKEYLYIPLGGNRKGKIRTYFNLLIVMTLGGLWHGAGFKYLIWGTIHGFLLAIERLLGIQNPTKQFRNMRILIVFTVISFAWLLFKMPNVSIIIELLKHMINNFHFPENYRIIIFSLLFSFPPLAYHVVYFKFNNIFNKLKLRPIIYSILVFLILVNSGSSNEFIYFQF